MPLATVFQTFNSAQAQLVRSRLEANGFPVYVAHELSSLSIEGYALASGGILVQVPEDRVLEARALLDSENDSGANENSP
jgi:hypothetical protein